MKTFFIKTFFSLMLLILSCSEQYLFSQVTAGSVPPGTSIIENVVDMSIVENEHDTTTYLDIDGDGTQDIRIWFLKGFPPADGSNFVALYVLNNSFSFCVYSGQPGKTSYFELGDILCTIGQDWGVDSLYIVGCYGGWTCTGDTSSINDKFIAYRKNSSGEVGWINVSMSLYSADEPRTITFKINELLVLYLASGINPLKDQFAFDLVPNPTLDGRFEIHCNEKLSSVELYDAAGQLIRTYLANDTDLLLPQGKGLYIVKIRNEKGVTGSRKIVRL